MVSEVFSHVHPAARAVLGHSEAERIAWLRRERWIGYPRAHQALTILEELLSLPVRQRMPNLLIIGPTNNGKTMIVEKFCRDHPSGPSADGEHEVIPVVIVTDAVRTGSQTFLCRHLTGGARPAEAAA
jgi:hypothetical protein